MGIIYLAEVDLRAYYPHARHPVHWVRVTGYDRNRSHPVEVQLGRKRRGYYKLCELRGVRRVVPA